MDGPTLAEFIAAWPTGRVDDRQKLATAWSLLPFAERRKALDGIGPFLDECKRVGRKAFPAGQTYLRDRPWHELGTKPRGPAPGAVRSLKAWTREWWAVLLARVERGERVAVMLHLAETGSGQFTEREVSIPPASVIEQFKGFPSDGEAFAAWRPWLEARGVNLPAWRDTRMWVWLPADRPPGDSAAKAGSEISDADYAAMTGKR